MIVKSSHRFKDSLLRLNYARKILKPQLYARILKSYAKYALGKHHLRYANVAFDYTCNFRCRHCFVESFRKTRRSRMTVDKHRQFANQAMKLGVWDFSFQGGEPFLPKSFNFLMELLPVYEPAKNLLSVVTNGMFVTEEKLETLKNLDVDILTVSIDSGFADEHDRFRGIKHSYQRSINAVNMALDTGLNVIINTVFSHQNIHSEGIQKIIRFAESKGLLLNTLLAVPIGRWKESKYVTLTPEDWDFYREIQREHPNVQRDIGFSFAKNGCGAVKEMIYLTAYGDVCPCPFLHVSLGNIREEPLKQILERGLETEKLGKYHPKCLVAEDHDFIRKYLVALEKTEKRPVPLSEVQDLFGVRSKWDEVWSHVTKPSWIGEYSQKQVYALLDELLGDKLGHLLVLDVGCGSGLTLDFLRDRFPYSMGIDNSIMALRLCAAKGYTVGVDVYYMDAEKMLFPTDAFDLVFSWGLLEHFRNFNGIVDEMCRVSDRYILLVQPNVHSYYGKLLFKLTNLLGRGVDEHPYRMQDFIDAFQQRGFKLTIRKSTVLGEFEVLQFTK